jgi:hypothetical protein
MAGLVRVFVRYRLDEPGVHFVAGGVQIGKQPLSVIGIVVFSDSRHH